jgi:mannose/cellobiose epimerase-like protein (N-acyl-D-glucosamine 2-epimerase family)
VDAQFLKQYTTQVLEQNQESVRQLVRLLSTSAMASHQEARRANAHVHLTAAAM